MATFNGTITAISPIQSGTSKSGKAWRKIDAVLEYEHGQYPKAIVFAVMNDKIEELNLKPGGEYEVEVDFSAREYNGKYYMSANAWKATAKTSAPAQAPANDPYAAAGMQPTQKASEAQPQGSDDLSF